VLDHDGMRIIETSAIARYLNDVLPGKSLIPATPKDRARMDRCASRAAVISYGSVLHAKLTPWIGSVELGADQASIGSGMTKIGMVRLAKYTPFGVMWRRCSGQT
jgi:glutathione S-transferase